MSEQGPTYESGVSDETARGLIEEHQPEPPVGTAEAARRHLMHLLEHWGMHKWSEHESIVNEFETAVRRAAISDLRELVEAARAYKVAHDAEALATPTNWPIADVQKEDASASLCAAVDEYVARLRSMDGAGT